jgi:serine/threonine protein kinase
MVLPNLEEEYFVPRGIINHLAFVWDILEAMNRMLQKSIVHRDIKPSNIDRAKDGTWILFDFNSATRLLEVNQFKSFDEGVGTEGNRASEVEQVDPAVGYDFKADVFSFGQTLLEMCQRGKH